MTTKMSLKLILLLLGILALIFSTTNTAYSQSEWNREVALRFNQTGGNTEKAQFSVGGLIAKEFVTSRFSSSVDINYGSSSKIMDTQNWNSVTKYSFDFGQNYQWFNIYSLQVDHDRFADIDYRITPAVGLGYWLSREEDWTWSADLSLGYEITKYRSSTPDEETAVVIAHTYMKKRIFDSAFISEDFYIIPSLEGTGTRFKSITAFINPVSENIDLDLSYIVDHDTMPSPGKKKTDTKFLAGLKYRF